VGETTNSFITLSGGHNNRAVNVVLFRHLLLNNTGNGLRFNGAGAAGCWGTYCSNYRCGDVRTGPEYKKIQTKLKKEEGGEGDQSAEVKVYSSWPSIFHFEKVRGGE